jgi:hypothetical protein
MAHLACRRAPDDWGEQAPGSVPGRSAVPMPRKSIIPIVCVQARKTAALISIERLRRRRPVWRKTQKAPLRLVFPFLLSKLVSLTPTRTTPFLIESFLALRRAEAATAAGREREQI